MRSIVIRFLNLAFVLNFVYHEIAHSYENKFSLVANPLLR